MPMTFKEFTRYVKELDGIVDPETEVSFVDEYGDTYPAQTLITYEKGSKTILVIE